MRVGEHPRATWPSCLRPELNQEYSNLCNRNRPFTKYLFGDDVSRSAKEIEDCSKISNRMFQNRYREEHLMLIDDLLDLIEVLVYLVEICWRGRGQVPNYGEPNSALKNLTIRGF